MGDELRRLIERHCRSLKKLADEVGLHLALIANGGAVRRAELDRVLDVAHQINGSSGSIGFIEISESAADLEDQLKMLSNLDPEHSADSLILAAMASFERLRRLVDNLTPQQSALFDIDLSRIGSPNKKIG